MLFALAVYYSSTIFSSIPPPAKLARANRSLPDAVLNIAEGMPEYLLALTDEVLAIAHWSNRFADRLAPWVHYSPVQIDYWMPWRSFVATSSAEA